MFAVKIYLVFSLELNHYIMYENVYGNSINGNRHDITEILLKVALNNIIPIPHQSTGYFQGLEHIIAKLESSLLSKSKETDKMMIIGVKCEVYMSQALDVWTFPPFPG